MYYVRWKYLMCLILVVFDEYKNFFVTKIFRITVLAVDISSRSAWAMRYSTPCHLAPPPPKHAHIYASLQKFVQDMRSLLHQADVLRPWVPALAVGDGIDEPVVELLRRAKEVGFDKVDHGVIWGERRGGEGGGESNNIYGQTLHVAIKTKATHDNCVSDSNAHLPHVPTEKTERTNLSSRYAYISILLLPLISTLPYQVHIHTLYLLAICSFRVST